LLTREAQALLDANRVADAIVPSRFQYPHQWMWDACLHAIALAHGPLDAACDELDSVLSGQWDDGMLPHVRFLADPPAPYRPGPTQWATGRASTGITQPPLPATALRWLHEAGAERARVARAFERIVRFHRWLQRVRDPGDTGLLGIVHPWESGTDNSPIFDAARDSYLADHPDAPLPQRADTSAVADAQRPRDDDYRFYWGLITHFQRLGWDGAAMVADSPFLLADLTFNGVWARANADLAVVARDLGHPDLADGCERRARRTREALVRSCWDAGRGFLYPLDLRTRRPVRIKTCGGLLPLFGGLPDATVTGALVGHLTDPTTFAAPHGVPSVALDEPSFDPLSYWRGPVWIHVHWMLVRGLCDLGRRDLAADLAEHSRSCVATSGYREYYHPHTGAGLGAREFSWSVLADVSEPR